MPLYQINWVSIAKVPNKTLEHKHTSWETAYYMNTGGISRINNVEYVFEQGDILCIPPNMSHYEFADTDMEIGCLSIDPFLNLEDQVYHFKDTANKDFLSIFMQIYRLYQLRMDNWINITSKLLEVLEQFILSWTSTSIKNPYIEMFKNILLSNFTNFEVNIDELLTGIPISNTYFRKLFKRETGKTIVQYLTDLRISHAKHLLLNYHMTVKNTALSVGYKDQYYFSRAFKKVLGMSPKKWKKVYA